MRSEQSLSLKQARRLALAAQGFHGRATKRVQAPKAAQIRSALQRLAVVQIDSVNALVRSHYLPLFSRLGVYPQVLLEREAWGPKRSLFECWGHEASLMPLERYPLMVWRMQRARAGTGIYKQLAAFGREQQPLIKQVLQQVHERGASGAGSLASGSKGTGGWWGWSAEKHALEWLFAAGEVTVAQRKGFERLYDLPQRVLPKAVLEQPVPDEAESQRQLLLIAAHALGVATEADLRDYFRLDAVDSKARLAELLEEGALQRMSVEGWTQAAYAPMQISIPRKVQRSALLSPFDSLIWARPRTERLFDFRYRLEIYTPQHKREYGYYVLPFLHNEQLLARVDLRAERAAGVLAVHALHAEVHGLDEEALRALQQNLLAMCEWLGLHRVQNNCQSDLARRLQMLNVD
ncbi:MAG: winged helix-turn-helix domain-containing protein [Pseudomonas marincola]|uniref:winged helix-turn-helix domain-containing protein n=1 Tax=Pseudomonas marincola TaxID=437900 RepID=UPI00300246A9